VASISRAKSTSPSGDVKLYRPQLLRRVAGAPPWIVWLWMAAFFLFLSQLPYPPTALTGSRF
ncbi:MAG: hypothetical protein ACC663_09430, partial [Gammaproteobacteria bacterium]